MKEQLYMIPINDALNANDECPFCYIERQIEQNLLDFVLGSGSSYMESDIREQTDKQGFCRAHFKKMFDYGNTLGNGWILKTHYRQMLAEFDKQTKAFCPNKASFKSRFRKDDMPVNSLSAWVREKENSCYICNYYREHYDRYMDTFFLMYKRDAAFRQRVKDSKGFCLSHFGDLCAAGESRLSEKEMAAFYEMLTSLTRENLARLYEDVSWLIEKFDYRNKDADWKNSKDAIQRGMQKLKGGYPADPVYKQNK